MVKALKYEIMDKKIPKGEADKGLGLGSTPDWSAQGDFHYFPPCPSWLPVWA